MRKVLLRVLIGMLVSGILSTAAMAEDVCVTKRGKRYHKIGSRFLKGREFEVLPREDAEAKGYKPSSEFFRDNEITDDGKDSVANADNVNNKLQ